MSEIKIEKPTKEKLSELGVFSWPIWQKEASCFDWHYDETEVCYLLEGRVIVKAGDGERIEFGAGDLVTFPEGLSCAWDIKEPVKKHYSFK